MDVKGAIFDLSTIRSLYSIIDNFNYKGGFLAGVEGFNKSPLKKFKGEFPSVIKALKSIDDSVFSKNNLDSSHEFVIHYENDVAEMDCVTFFVIDGELYFVDIEVKETDHIEQLKEQFQNRENDSLVQLNLNKNYILLGFLNGVLRMGVIKNDKGRKEFNVLDELSALFDKKTGTKPAVRTLLRAVEGILKIQDVKNKIEKNDFKYYVATKNAFDSARDNIRNGRRVLIIRGNAGSGKTVIAFSLFFNFQNTKLLLLNRMLYESLNMWKYYSDKRCSYGTERFIEGLTKDTVAIVDESQRLSLNDAVRIVEASKAVIFLGDENQAFAPGDSLLNAEEFKGYLLSQTALKSDDVAIAKIKRTARYNSKVNKLLEALHNNDPIVGYDNNVSEKVGDEYTVDITMSEKTFLEIYHSANSTSGVSKIYMPHLTKQGQAIIDGETFQLAGRDDEGFSLSNYLDHYIGNVYHAISFDVDNSFVLLKGVGIREKDGCFYLYDKSLPDGYWTEKNLKKYGNQINVLFTRGRKSLHILTDDFYVYSYLNFKIKRGIK